jgi:hypothetical protein
MPSVIEITSGDILKMLEQRHDKDLFVPECKNGSTWFQNHSRVDAWAMKKSWQNPCYIGYEIKISKSDFIHDSKYVNYLPMCNELYFICPWDMIKVSDIPLEVGLIYCSKNGTSLLTRKKAVHREIEAPINTLLYILICRTRITAEQGQTKAEYWNQWYQNKKEEIEIGRLSSKRLRDVVNKKILEVRDKNKELEYENGRLKKLVDNCNEGFELLRLAGIDKKAIESEYSMKHKINSLLAKLSINPEEFIDNIKRVNSLTSHIVSMIDKPMEGK